MFQALSRDYLEGVDSEKDDDEELGDLLKDVMVHNLVKGVEPSSFETQARSLQKSLEEGVSSLDVGTLITRGTMWLGSLLNKRLLHKHELKKFVTELNSALTAYAELICAMLHVDYHKRVETGAIRMQTNEGVSTRLMMVSRIMDVLVETSQMVAYNHSRRQLGNNSNMDLDSNKNSHNATESHGLGGAVADDQHDNQQVRPRPRPRHNQAHVKHEGQPETEDKAYVDIDGDADFQGKQDGDRNAEPDDEDDTDSKSGEGDLNQGKYNLRAKYESKNHGKRRAKVVEPAADESEGMNEAESGQAEESPAGPSTTPRRKKTKRSIISGKVGNMR